MFRITEDEPPIPETVSPLLDDFLRQCFQRDPAKRPDAGTLCEHEWLKENRVLQKVCFPRTHSREDMCTDEIRFRNFVHRIVSPPFVTIEITPGGAFGASVLQAAIPRNPRLLLTTRHHVLRSLLLPPLLVRQVKITMVPLFGSTRLSGQRSTNVSDNACVRECTLVYQSSLSSCHLSSLYSTRQKERRTLRSV